MSIQRVWVTADNCREGYVVRCDMCGAECPNAVVVTRVDSYSVKRGLKRLKEIAADMDLTAVKDRHFCSGCYYEWEHRAVPKTGLLFDLGPQGQPRYGKRE